MSLQHIVVGLSGGVDSAVAAHLLKAAGHKVDAVFMKNWDEDDTDEFCSAAQDLADAEQICDQLKISLRTVNFSSEYWELVFEYFLAEHRASRTPNPDILCNTEIKFKVFLDYAAELGAQQIATGHYARIGDTDIAKTLRTAKDTNKDQTYFLHGLNQRQLKKSIFPLGDLEKTQVRQIAADLNLHIHGKKDSTGICFIGERKFRTFLEQYIDVHPGNIVDTQGNIIGQHQGITFFTIGQRQGLGIGGITSASEDPWYVVDKRIQSNELVVAQGSEHPALYSDGLIIENMHWINENPIDSGTTVHAKIRYRQQPQQCHVTRLNEQQWRLQFDEAQRAITPGQYAVLYATDMCLGGGVISNHV